MEMKKITLSICNQNVVVSINAEKEGEFREVAKSINDEFNKRKDAYDNVDDAKLTAVLLLEASFKLHNAATPKESKPSFMKRLSELFCGDD